MPHSQFCRVSICVSPMFSSSLPIVPYIPGKLITYCVVKATISRSAQIASTGLIGNTENWEEKMSSRHYSRQRFDSTMFSILKLYFLLNIDNYHATWLTLISIHPIQIIPLRNDGIRPHNKPFYFPITQSDQYKAPLPYTISLFQCR